ncbi:MAG: anti-sigma factor antagonist [Spartobacteria bacterium]|nr:anti-sigma factor antagonist [Spartobacteria bacterium]
MQLIHTKSGNTLYTQVSGRLDASWADYFTDAMFEHVRAGDHQIVLDMTQLAYLSSAGIRSLLRLYKKLLSVQGSFSITHAQGIVYETLHSSGFDAWLSERPGDSTLLESSSEKWHRDVFELGSGAPLHLGMVSAWQPWKPVVKEHIETVPFSSHMIGVGIGSDLADIQKGSGEFGEFVAACGYVAMQPPDERAKPDYLLSEQQFIPALQCIQSLTCQGEMSYLLRFNVTEEQPVWRMSDLVHRMLSLSRSAAVGFTMIGEIEGLVGASLIQSPSHLKADESVTFPAVQDWLRFSGERLFAGEQALITGVALGRKSGLSLQPLSNDADVGVHLHAVVFPYQPLPNGMIDLNETVGRFFHGATPRAVMHLVNDERPVNGLGESALLRGACWFGSIENPEILQ